MSGYAIDSLGYDPYFMQAYQSYNPNFYGLPQNAGYVPQAADTTSVMTAAAPTAPTVPAADKKDEGSSAAAWAVVGTVATVGAALLCRKAYKAGSGTGMFEKIGNGVKSWFNKAKSSATNGLPQKFTVTKNADGKYLCTVPERMNVIRTNQTAERLAELGVSTDAPALTRVVRGENALGEGIKLRDYTFTLDGNTFAVKKGKISKYTNSSGENLIAKYKNPTEQADIDYKKAIDEMIAKFNKGQELDKLTNISFSHTADGTTRLFTMGSIAETPVIRSAASTKFTLNSDAAMAYRYKHEAIDAAVKELEKKGSTNGLKLSEAQYTNSLGTFQIKDGKITQLTTPDGTRYTSDTDRFAKLQGDNKKVFDAVLNKQKDFTNCVYQAA